MNERELRVRLGYWLQGERACQTPGWLAAFQDVPRHLLVPEGWLTAHDGSRIHSSEMSLAEWIESVYHDMGVVIRDDRRGRSSSSAPGVMAKMLDLLRVEDRDTVLEIGTGSGYNAALLCHRLGAERVTSIDMQGDLVDTARERLLGIGYQPCLTTADGLGGYPSRAPYDRVIGTCLAWPIPRAWIDQTRRGGRVVALVPDGCVGLDVRADGAASGRFHPQQFSFMPMVGYMPTLPASFDPEELTGTARRWRYPPDILFAGGWDQSSFTVLVLALVVRDQHRWDRWDLDGLRGLIDLGDGSWVRFSREGGEVVEGGPRQIWDAIEALYEHWCRLGAPNRERFGLTVEADGHHVIWLDDPDSERRWEVIDGGDSHSTDGA
jgi:protein-L-isoaspartate O-methyltransferase